MHFDADFSDNNSYTTSANFRLRVPLQSNPSRPHFQFDSTSLHYQPSPLNYRDSVNLPDYGLKNPSNTESVDWEMKTLNNSEQMHIFETKDRRPTMNVLPNLHSRLNPDLAHSQKTDFYKNPQSRLFFPRADSEVSRDQEGSLFRVFSTPQRPVQSGTGVFTNQQNSSDLFAHPPAYIKEKFGSILVSKPKNYHRHSMASIPSESTPVLPGTRPRNNSHKVPNQSLFVQPPPLAESPSKSHRFHPKPYKVSSMHTLPEKKHSFYSSRSIDKHSQKKSFFGLNIIKEKREDEPERKVSQSFDGPNSSSTPKHQLFPGGTNKGSRQKTGSRGTRHSGSLKGLSHTSTSHVSLTRPNPNFSQTKSEYQASPFRPPTSTSLPLNNVNTHFRSFQADSEKNIQKADQVFNPRILGDELNSGPSKRRQEDQKYLVFTDQSVENQQESVNQMPHLQNRSKEFYKLMSDSQNKQALFLHAMEGYDGKESGLFGNLPNQPGLVNSKSVKKKSLFLQRIVEDEDLVKVSPKIQKKKKIWRQKRKESLFKNLGKLNTHEAINQLSSREPAPPSKPDDIPYMHLASIDSKKNMATQKHHATFPRRPSENLLPSLNPLLSPAPHQRYHPQQDTQGNNSSKKNRSMVFNFSQKFSSQSIDNGGGLHFHSSRKPKSPKMYSLTPNPKLSSEYLSNNLRRSSKLLQVNLARDAAPFGTGIQGTPPIKNSNIVTNSSFTNQSLLQNLHPGATPFGQEPQMKRHAHPNKPQGQSGTFSSSLLSSQAPSRPKVEARMFPPSNPEPPAPAQFRQNNPFTAFPAGPSNPPSAQSYKMANPSQSRNFPLQIPNQNQIQYSNWQAYPNNPVHVPLNQEKGTHSGGQLIDFLGARGSILQRQFEQKVFQKAPAVLDQKPTVLNDEQKEIRKSREAKKNEEPVFQKEKKKRRRRRGRGQNRNRRQFREVRAEDRGVDYWDEPDQEPKKKKRNRRRRY